MKCVLSEINFLQGFDCGLHPRGVAVPEARAAPPVQGRDAGELQELHLGR